jgi:hypothetical protein
MSNIIIPKGPLYVVKVRMTIENSSHLFRNLINPTLAGKQNRGRQDTLNELAADPLVQPFYSLLPQDGKDAV